MKFLHIFKIYKNFFVKIIKLKTIIILPIVKLNKKINKIYYGNDIPSINLEYNYFETFLHYDLYYHPMHSVEVFLKI